MNTNRIADNIRQLRELRNYTQEYMAEKLAIAREIYGKIERGEPGLKVETLYKIATVFNVQINTLLDFDSKIIFNDSKNRNADTSSSDEAIKSLTHTIKFLQEQNALLIQMMAEKKETD